MRFKPGHKEETRLRMLDAAAQHVRRRGPDGVAIAEVMAEAGVTVGAFYKHFESREAIVQQAIDHMYTTSPAPLLMPDAAETPQAVLRGFLDYYLSVEHRDTRTGGCPLPFLTADAIRLPQAARQRLSNALNAVIDLVAGHIAAMKPLDLEGTPHQIAASVTAEVIGAVILARAEVDPERSARLLGDSKAAILRRMGLGTPA